jgi:Homeodomain-like domain
MHTPGTNIVRAVETAAELRAAGHSWAHIAAAVRRSKKTVQRWPQRYADAWNRAAAETRRDLLRSENERTRRDAARDLVHLSIDVEPADVPAARSPFHALADHLAGLTDEQHRRLLEEEEPEPEPAPDATGDPEAA